MKKLITIALLSAIAALSGGANAQSTQTTTSSAAAGSTTAKATTADPFASAGVYDRCITSVTQDQVILVTAGKDDKGRWYTCGKNSGMTINNLPSFYATTLASFYCEKSKPISSVPVGEDGNVTIYCTYNNSTSAAKINGNAVKIIL